MFLSLIIVAAVVALLCYHFNKKTNLDSSSEIDYVNITAANENKGKEDNG